MTTTVSNKNKKASEGGSELTELNFQKNLDGKIGPCDTFNYNFKTKPYIYGVIRPIIRVLIRIGWKISVKGKNNIPKDSNVIFMPNHTSHFDAFLVGSYFRDTPVGIIDEKLFKNKLFKLFATSINGFPVRKGTKSLAIVEYAISRINRGDSMLWFPEGQRNKNPSSNKMMKGKLGSGMLAHKTKAPIVPIFIEGAEFAMGIGKTLSLGRGLRSIQIKIKFGEPVYLDDLRQLPSSKEASQKVVNRIMEHIEKLRPEGPYMIQKTRF